MEDNILNTEISNIYDFKSIEESYIYTKNIIGKLFPEFKLICSTYVDTINNINSSYGFVTLEYQFEKYYFKISCERGVIGYELKINNNYIPIHQYIKHTIRLLAFSKKNILFVLNIIRKIIGEP